MFTSFNARGRKIKYEYHTASHHTVTLVITILNDVDSSLLLEAPRAFCNGLEELGKHGHSLR